MWGDGMQTRSFMYMMSASGHPAADALRLGGPVNIAPRRWSVSTTWRIWSWLLQADLDKHILARLVRGRNSITTYSRKSWAETASLGASRKLIHGLLNRWLPIYCRTERGRWSTTRFPNIHAARRRSAKVRYS